MSGSSWRRTTPTRGRDHRTGPARAAHPMDPRIGAAHTRRPKRLYDDGAHKFLTLPWPTSTSYGVSYLDADGFDSRLGEPPDRHHDVQCAR